MEQDPKHFGVFLCLRVSACNYHIVLSFSDRLSDKRHRPRTLASELDLTLLVEWLFGGTLNKGLKSIVSCLFQGVVFPFDEVRFSLKKRNGS